MNCSCIYVECDEFITLLSDQIIKKAKKEHKCNECGEIISIGDGYRKECFIFEGFNIHKTCSTCNSIREIFFCDNIIYSEMIYYLEQEIDEMKGDINQTCIAQLISSARNKVCDMIEEYWDEE